MTSVIVSLAPESCPSETASPFSMKRLLECQEPLGQRKMKLSMLRIRTNIKPAKTLAELACKSKASLIIHSLSANRDDQPSLQAFHTQRKALGHP